MQRGEEAAFRRLVDECQERVLNTCLGFLPNLHDAEDLTQEVFVEAFRSVGNFRGESSLSTWLYRIAVSKSLQQIRRRQRQKRVAFFRSLVGLEEEQAGAVTDEFNHPGVALENSERAKLLFEKMSQLPENQRTAFVLHKVEGLSHKEIGEVMQLKVPAVEALIFRAKRRLQELLRDFYEGKMI